MVPMEYMQANMQYLITCGAQRDLQLMFLVVWNLHGWSGIYFDDSTLQSSRVAILLDSGIRPTALLFAQLGLESGYPEEPQKTIVFQRKSRNQIDLVKGLDIM